MLHAYGLGNIEETGVLGHNQDKKECDLIIKFCNIVWPSYTGRTIKLNRPYAPPRLYFAYAWSAQWSF